MDFNHENAVDSVVQFVVFQYVRIFLFALFTQVPLVYLIAQFAHTHTHTHTHTYTCTIILYYIL